MVNIQLPDALLVKIMLQVTRDALANKGMNQKFMVLFTLKFQIGILPTIFSNIHQSNKTLKSNSYNEEGSFFTMGHANLA
jgi:hypothetical protein